MGELPILRSWSLKNLALSLGRCTWLVFAKKLGYKGSVDRVPAVAAVVVVVPCSSYIMVARLWVKRTASMVLDCS